jgi:hypothetical protein
MPHTPSKANFVFQESWLNDPQIRKSFHSKMLRHHQLADGTLVVDELGLLNGKYRADIAVINGYLIGFEIKSDRDTLTRLPQQISAYDAIFDFISILVTNRHLDTISGLVPSWWGITLCVESRRGVIHFNIVRKPSRNHSVDPRSIVQLLWRSEVIGILKQRGEKGSILREPRRVLYTKLVSDINSSELKQEVRQHLKIRKNWRSQELRSRCGGLSRPTSR